MNPTPGPTRSDADDGAGVPGADAPGGNALGTNALGTNAHGEGMPSASPHGQNHVPHARRIVVLVVDDEPRIRSLIGVALDGAEFEVVTAAGGLEGLEKVFALHPDVVLLDILMPDMDGIEVMRQIRERSTVPIILLTAKTATADRKTGLDLGADDYVPKPFHPDELAARIRAVLRRVKPRAAGPRVICFDAIEIDLERRVVRRDGDVVQFSRTEWALLQHLAANANRVLLYPELLTKAYGSEYAEDFQYLRVWISRIRRKLGAPAGEQGRIRTYEGVGYLLDTSPAPSERASRKSARESSPG